MILKDDCGNKEQIKSRELQKSEFLQTEMKDRKV